MKEFDSERIILDGEFETAKFDAMCLEFVDWANGIYREFRKRNR